MKPQRQTRSPWSFTIRLIAVLSTCSLVLALTARSYHGAWFPTSSPFADVDSGSCGARSTTPSDPLILELQRQLHVDVGVRRYCIRSEGKPIANFSLAGGKRSILPADHYLNAVELNIFRALHQIYTQQEASPAAPSSSGKERWMLDIGMNAGLFTSHAATMGMSVLAFEPQLACIAMQHLSTTTNGRQAHVRLMNVGLGLPAATGSGFFEVHSDQCHGGFRYPDKWEPLDTKGVGLIKVPVVPLSNFLKGRHVLAAKMDVESNEIFVLESALEMLPSSLEYLVAEMNEKNWLGIGVSAERSKALTERLVALSRRVVNLDTMTLEGKGAGQPAPSFNGNYLFEFGRPLDLNKLQLHSLSYC